MDLGRLNRWGGYLFWVFLDQFLGAGVGRFFLNVAASHIVGTVAFGVFVTAQSVTALIGITPQMGLCLGLARHLVEYPPEEQASVCATAVRMCHRAMLIIMAIAYAGIGVAWASHRTPTVVLACLAPLVLALYAENHVTLIVTELNVRREFRYQAAWSALRTCGAFVAGLVGAMLAGPFGLACGYALGSWVAYAVLRWRRREWMRAPNHTEAARVLRSVWFHISLASMLGFAGDYLPRIVLSVWGSFEDVSHLYGAISIVALFLIAATGCGTFMTYMLAAFKTPSELTKTHRRLYALFAVSVVIGLSLMARFAGPFLLVRFYPHDLAEHALPLFSVVVIGITPVTIAVMVRPWVVKFSPTRAIPMVNGCVLTGQLLPALILTPLFGARGAAWGLVIGGTTHMLAMLVIPLVMGRRGRGCGEAGEAAGAADKPSLTPVS
ncbi:MAG TPA: hypothetical protein VMV94_09295 [Phycisphaerae bacterium]|nr:hypothetical protein [Phycisphaerae bacterium]